MDMAPVWKLFLITCILMVLPKCSAVIDSLTATEYSRLPPLFSLDNYEVCLEPEDGLYCLVQLHLHSQPGNQLMETIREYSAQINRHYNHSVIDRGVCVRSKCKEFLKDRNLDNPQELTAVIEDCMNDGLQTEYGLNGKVAFYYYCHKSNEKMEIDSNDWTFAAVWSGLIFLVIFAGVYENYLDNGKEKIEGNQYLLCFSIRSNWKFLTTTLQDERLDNLRGFQAVRTILNVLMISVHATFFFIGSFTSNPQYTEKIYENGWYYLLLNGLVVIQVFFFISGFLLVYNIHMYSEKANVTWKHVPLYVAKRLFRLTPSLAIMLWFTTTWFRHMGSGPMWPVCVTNSVVADCRNNWWRHLLFIQNYGAANYCLLQTWHISADTQVFIVGLIVAVATLSKHRNLSLCVLMVVGTVAPAVNVWLYDLDPLVLMKPEFFRTLKNDTYHRMHILGHNNIQSYVIGMGVAKLVYDWRKKRIDLSNWKIYSKLLSLPLFLGALYFYSGEVFYTDYKPSLAYRMFYAATQRIILAVFTAFILIGLSMRLPSVVRNICESNVWVIPGRLTYAVYLIHMNLIHALIGLKQTTSESNIYHVFMMFIAIVVVSYALAVPYYLVVEAPFTRLCKVFTDNNLQKRRDAVKNKNK